MNHSTICRKTSLLSGIVGLLVFMAPVATDAAVITKYTNRALWDAAVHGRTLENFNSLPLQVLAKNATTTLGILDVEYVSPGGSGAIRVLDAAGQPLNINGTRFLRSVLDGGPSEQSYIKLAQPSRAWGVDYNIQTPSDPMKVSFNGYTESFARGTSGFVGYTSDEDITEVEFDDQFISAAVFGLDDFAVAEAADPVTAPNVRVFTDRASWQAALGAGPVVNETFDSLPEQTLANYTPTTLGSLEVTQFRPDGATGLVRVGLATAPDNVDGTRFLDTSLDGGPKSELKLSFPQDVLSWGADYNYPAPGDVARVWFDGFSHDLGVQSASGFIGFISDRSFNEVYIQDPFISFAPLSLDNVSYSSVPEPSTLLLGAGLCGLVGLRRRKTV